jgi:putative ABC transport system ATP-binding protein
MGRGAAVAELHDVSRVFPPDVVALDHLTLRLMPGEFVSITGPSGSGKSTLLNVVGLLDRPTSGTVLIDGVDAATVDEGSRTRIRASQLGFIFQDSHLVAHLTVFENVELGLIISGWPVSRRRDRALEVLDAVGLTSRSSAYPQTLSGGEKQRTAIARAIARSPRLLLCDEPTGNLDSANTQVVLDMLEQTHAADRALVVVTHESDVAARAMRSLRMVDGKFSLDGE